MIAAIMLAAGIAAQPTVLLLGDSITMGQSQFAIDALRDVARVELVPENGRSVPYKIANLDRLCMSRRWDIVYLQSGLHDVCVGEVEQYRSELPILIQMLSTYADVIVWGRTTDTDVAPDHPRHTSRIQTFNAAADEIISALGISSVDLFSISPLRYIKPDGVHFYGFGSRILAERTASAIRNEIRSGSAEPVSAVSDLGLLAIFAALTACCFWMLRH